MENKEMKKPIPVELNDEKLDLVTGGGQIAETHTVLVIGTGIALQDVINETPPCKEDIEKDTRFFPIPLMETTVPDDLSLPPEIQLRNDK